MLEMTCLPHPLKTIQKRNQIVDELQEIAYISDGEHAFPNFSVEMETGTGKTYAYLRTIFELYSKYGFSKFIIVVPSVAIREGVMTNISLTRRQTLAGLTASTALTLGGCAANGDLPRLRPIGTDPDEWLDSVSYRLLEHEPERATGLGVDTGEFAYLRGKLEDQSISGQREYAATLRWVVNQMTGLDESGLTNDQATSFEVVRSAFSTAAEGFDLPYGDVAVGSWRNAPYVVIQNVGTYLDMPRFMDASHMVQNAQDADAYIERLEQMPSVLDGELERLIFAIASNRESDGRTRVEHLLTEDR